MTPRTDPSEGLARAVTAAIADIALQIEMAGPKLGLLTMELEIDSKARVVGGIEGTLEAGVGAVRQLTAIVGQGMTDGEASDLISAGRRGA